VRDLTIIVITKPDFVECYWCVNGTRANVLVSEPTYGIFPEKKIPMCEEHFRMRKRTFPFEVLHYEMIKYKDG
jgi:hypothetical protein